MASSNFEKFQKLLEALFQLNQADLDFGIYRIMNQKRDEVVSFLEKDLLPQVTEAFRTYQSADTGEQEKALKQPTAQSIDAGTNLDDSPKVKALREKINNTRIDVATLESEVFSHLYSFFQRYYSEGDFISLRRYKKGVYAIPYEGEEVKLHWANHDQYYVKSSEHFRDYTFVLNSQKRVRMHLAAAFTEPGNQKAATGKERRFVICEQDPVYEKAGELFIRFEYRPVAGNKKQNVLNQAAIDRVLKLQGIENWAQELRTLAPTQKNKGRTVLEKHLMTYTSRNTFDYFIHKDLGGFLRRELDFYIKNEVMHLDDIENERAPRVEQYLSKIKVIRKIAHKIIRFLEQIENFQKKLWLKKKFVVETNYCIALGGISKALYPDIAANPAQANEWMELFHINDAMAKSEVPRLQTGESVALTVDFLKAHPNLVVDTRFFDSDFKRRLLANINRLDLQSNGVLVHADNFQAMSLLSTGLKEKVQCTYMDPPYNTGKDGFMYKDRYPHSSWLSFMSDRISLCRHLLSDSGALFCSIDDNEAKHLEALCNQIFGARNFLAPLFVQVRYASKTLSEDSDFQRTIEQILLYAKNHDAFKPIKEKIEYPLEKFCWKIQEKKAGEAFKVAGRRCWVFKPGDYAVEKCKPGLNHLKETWATGSLLRQKGSSGEFFGRYLAPRKEMDGLSCLYKVEGIGEDGLGFRYFLGPKKATASRGKFYSGIPLQTLEKIKAGDTGKEIPIANFIDFAGDFGNCRHEGKVDIRGGKKPEKLVKKLIQLTSTGNDRDVILDPFCGSGTTPAVAHKMGKNYVAIEQGEYFDSKVLVRMKHTLYESGGFFKYLRLESYEDALNNLTIQRTTQQQAQLDAHADLREDYTLSYMLDVETRGSQSLLNIDNFRNPDQYTLKIECNGETKTVNVDLVETFNWLLGLTVKHIDHIQGVRVIEGTNPADERVLILWRNLDETDNNALNSWFEDYNHTCEQAYDLLYVNGDNNLENLCRPDQTGPDQAGPDQTRPDQTWRAHLKVHLIEAAFQRLMFDTQNV